MGTFCQPNRPRNTSYTKYRYETLRQSVFFKAEFNSRISVEVTQQAFHTDRGIDIVFKQQYSARIVRSTRKPSISSIMEISSCPYPIITISSKSSATSQGCSRTMGSKIFSNEGASPSSPQNKPRETSNTVPWTFFWVSYLAYSTMFL